MWGGALARSTKLVALEDEVAAFETAFSRSARPSMHATIALMHRLCAIIEEALAAGHSRTTVWQLVAPARAVHARSAFIRRLQSWPRGYPGDFETVEWLADPRPRCADTDPVYWVEWYALNCAIAQQHRNKLGWQHKLVKLSGNQRILNIGCGGCADVAIDPTIVAGADIVLLDSDPDALALARSRLEMAASVKCLARDVIRGLNELVRLGPYGLIVCGGLFDYLSDAVISRLLRTLHQRALAPGGKIAFTNISSSNEFRIWIEFLAS